jgi:hypothetical protein
MSVQDLPTPSPPPPAAAVVVEGEEEGDDSPHSSGLMESFLAEADGGRMQEIRDLLAALREKQVAASGGVLAQQTAYEEGPERSLEKLMPTFRKLGPYKLKCKRLIKQVQAVRTRSEDLRDRANRMQNKMLPYDITPKPRSEQQQQQERKKNSDARA